MLIKMKAALCLMFMGGFLFLMSQEAMAIPAWSRLTGSACNSCHATPTWQLTPFGLEFLGNGHRLEAAPANFDITTQKLDNYLSLVWKFRAYAEEEKNPSSQFEQHSFSLYSGGALSDRFSYFTEMYLNENTGSTAGSNIVQGDASRKKLAEAFLQYNQPVGSGFITVRAGEILPEILHVFGVGARSAEQRALVLNDKANLDNPYRPFTRSQGVDAKLSIGPAEVVAGVVNGAMNNTNAIDANNHKDWYASALVKFDDYKSGAGLFHYDGVYSMYTTTLGVSQIDDPSKSVSFDNEFTKDGLLVRFIRAKWRIVGTYFMGEETVDVAGRTTKNEGYYGLVDFNITDKLGVFARYDMLDPDTDIGSNETTLIMLGVDGMLYMSDKTGARWNLELTQKETDTAAVKKIKRALVQITWAF
jgi:hypothetical protein